MARADTGRCPFLVGVIMPLNFSNARPESETDTVPSGSLLDPDQYAQLRYRDVMNSAPQATGGTAQANAAAARDRGLLDFDQYAQMGYHDVMNSAPRVRGGMGSSGSGPLSRARSPVPAWRPADDGAKRPSLYDIVNAESDPIRAANKAADAGYGYLEIDQAISRKEAEQKRIAAIRERITAANVAADLAGQVVIGAQTRFGGGVSALGDFIAVDPNRPIDAYRDQGIIDNTRQIIGSGIHDMGQEVWREGKANEKTLRVEMPNPALEGVYSGVKSFIKNGPWGGVGPAGDGFDKYAEAREEHYSPSDAALIGATSAGIDYLAGDLGKILTKDPVGKELVRKYGIEAVLGQLTKHAQDAIDQGAGLSGKRKGDWNQYWQERPDAAVQVLMGQLSQSGIRAGLDSAGRRLSRNQPPEAPGATAGAQGTAPAGQRTAPATPEHLSGIEARMTPHGNLVVSGRNAQEAIRALVPDARLARRGDGSVMVAVSQSQAVSQALMEALGQPNSRPAEVQRAADAQWRQNRQMHKLRRQGR